MLTLFIAIIFCVSWSNAQAKIPIYPLTNFSNGGTARYFSDPYHVPYHKSKEVYISGTTHKYLECDDFLQPGCASSLENKYISNHHLNQTAKHSGTTICGAAGIHPFQRTKDGKRSWDAIVTLHVQDNNNCSGISGWSVIVHAHPEHDTKVDSPPKSWIGDQVLVGSFAKNVPANYDGKYFQTPDGELYLVYQKQHSKKPKRDGVFAWRLDNPTTKKAGSKPIMLLLPDKHLNSENYVGSPHFKLIETGNIRAIAGKFVMAYSVGAYNHPTYKMGIAYSDTFLPTNGKPYRKVMKDNPHNLWKSKGPKEVYYLLQSEVQHDGWRYVGDQVLAPGVPTVAQIGPNGGWVATFAGFDPGDAPLKKGTDKFVGSHRRPYFVELDVKVPKNVSVKDASDGELQGWITPVHKKVGTEANHIEL
ncbi:hypothetical protein BT63DRAFT_180901 [Microthyrium microscopicum]|uniref:Uncharacterized protein n=1 Tax=Microthyrium microscopicum TaxID=703497 RepID=A0A6A6UK37_9PEZI|nr:hypothetical protein BT63DRAFT_180901 [Microthyrium microscopicum]